MAIKIPVRRIQEIFRSELGLKYKNVKRISYNANTEKNLVMRKMFAGNLLKLLDMKRRIINIDESWLNDTMQKRKKWREHGSTNSVCGHQVNPRISLIGGIDTLGNVYISAL